MCTYALSQCGQLELAFFRSKTPVSSRACCRSAPAASRLGKLQELRHDQTESVRTSSRRVVLDLGRAPLRASFFAALGLIATNMSLPSRLGGALLQQARDGRAVDLKKASRRRNGHGCRAIASGRTKTALAVKRAGLQPGQPMAAAGTATKDQELVADELAAAADEDGAG